jgi:hypothetical protein
LRLEELGVNFAYHAGKEILSAYAGYRFGDVLSVSIDVLDQLYEERAKAKLRALYAQLRSRTIEEIVNLANFLESSVDQGIDVVIGMGRSALLIPQEVLREMVDDLVEAFGLS